MTWRGLKRKEGAIGCGPCWLVAWGGTALIVQCCMATARYVRCFWPANASTVASVSGGVAAMWTVARFVTEFAVAYAALWMAAELAIMAMRR
jgi:hypothetical protein